MNMITEIEGLPAVGEWLRRSRTEAGRSLDDVAGALGIRTGYLDALERGELSRFFGPTYVESMVVRYALHLGIDPDAVLLQAAREPGPSTPSGTRPRPPVVPPAARRSTVSPAGKNGATAAPWATVGPVRTPTAEPSSAAPEPPSAPEVASIQDHPPAQAAPQHPEGVPGFGASTLGNGDTPAWLAEDRPPTRMDLPDGRRWSRSSETRPPEHGEAVPAAAPQPARSIPSTPEALLADLERIAASPASGRRSLADNDVPPVVPESRVARNKARAVARRGEHESSSARVGRTESGAADKARARGDFRLGPRLSRAWVVPPLAVILAVLGLFGAQQFGLLSLFGGDDGATSTTLQAAVSSFTTTPSTSTAPSSSSVTSAAAAAPLVSSTESTMLSATTTTGSGALVPPAAGTTTTASSTTSTAPAPTSTTTTTPATPAAPSTGGGFALVFKATTADVWVELTSVDTGRVLHAGVVAKGGSLDVKVDGPVNAVIGKPEAVAVTVDGQTVAAPRAFKWRITSAGIEQRG